jgi:hypothetical protein
MEFSPCAALGEQFESQLDGRHPQSDLSCQKPGAARLKIKERSARPAASGRSLGNLLEELTRSSIFPFVESEVRLLQNGRDLLGERLADVTAEQAAH